VRGMVEDHAVGSRRRPGSPYKLVLAIPTMWWVILSGALHNFNMYALGAFLVPFLIRYHHVSLSSAGKISMWVYGFSGIAGLIIGGIAADRMYRRRIDGRLIVATVALAISAPPMYLALTRAGGDWVTFGWLMGVGIGVMYVYYTIQDVVEPALRGTAMALYFCAMYLLGASLGPVGTGLISDYFTFQKATAAGAVAPMAFGPLMAAELRSLVGESKGFPLAALEPFRADGLHTAMYVVPILAAILAVVLFAASRTVTADVQRLQKWMREGAEVRS
jgi:MFS family permease